MINERRNPENSTQRIIERRNKRFERQRHEKIMTQIYAALLTASVVNKRSFYTDMVFKEADYATAEFIRLYDAKYGKPSASPAPERDG